MMCEFNGIRIGSVVTFNLFATCWKCQIPYRETSVDFVYEGHRTDGVVYDVFTRLIPTQCPHCGIEWTGWAKPCNEAGVWSFAEIAMTELDAAAKE